MMFKIGLILVFTAASVLGIDVHNITEENITETGMYETETNGTTGLLETIKSQTPDYYKTPEKINWIVQIIVLLELIFICFLLLAFAVCMFYLCAYIIRSNIRRVCLTVLRCRTRTPVVQDVSIRF
ncbi:Protein CBG27674 [Caenorhabditis briggsae]|uniref:Protein CBG27674 n=2 Tax=Caenorhabditis briggsae TaxID=6238 RepID=B6IJB9_CAEBR|nr:Protein CBG27674 [Caenorhabditis briggsae]ULT82074.1 hypothetical protein L3Y34_011796 [Caenorhabditis briggsae]CAR99953.1 Protein CBG27674 [Caenorhabditis briggsae]